MTPPSPVLLVCTCLCVFLAVGQGQGNREHSSKVGVVVVVTDGVNTIDGRCHDDDNKLSEKGGNETSSTRDDPNRMMTSHFSSWIRGIVEVLDTSLAPDYEAVLVEGPCTEPGTTMHSFMSVVTAHRVTGVLSVTSSDTSKALRDVTSYLQLPLVEMVHGDLLVTPSVGPLHYVVPHFHYTLAQNVLFISHLFNWTAVSVTSPGQPRSANGVMDVFQRLASENGLCVLPAYLSEDVPRIVFGHLHANTTPSQLSSTSNLFVEHVDVDVLESFERNSSTGADMLYLQSMQYQWRQLAMMINSSCAQNSDVRNTTSSQNSSSSVDVFETFQLCSLEDSFQSFSSDTRAQIVHLVASISLLLSKSNIDLKTSSFCTHTQSSSSVMCLMFDPRLYRLDLNTNTVELVEELYRIRDVSDLDLSQRSKSVQMRGHTLLLPINLTDYVGRESCGNLCRYCARCLPSKMSDMTIMTSGEGELYVLGLFPIHKISPDGQCNLANPIGYAESVVFVDEFKKQQALLPSVGRRNIAAVVFDTCGSTAHAYTVINQVDSCDFTFQESQERRPIFIQPDSVVGIIESENDFGDTFVSNSKFRLVLDESGFSTSADLPITFIDNVLATLAHLQWTVINVIVSEDSEMLKLSEYLKTANSARTFCFVIHLVLPSSEDGLQVINRAFAGVTKTSVFLLLTTPRDTQELLHHLRVHADAKAVRLQYIFTPWNEKLHEYPDVEESSDTNIVFRSSSLSSSSPVVNVSLIKTSVNPWSSEFANSSTGLETLLEDGDHSEKFDVVQAMVQQLLPQLNSFNHPDKDFSSLVLTSTKLDVVAFYANGRTKAELGHVDGSVFTPTAKFFGRPHNTCSGWCPACNVCKAPAPPPPTSDHAHLHLSGDVIITGLFPLHSPGTEPFMCGQLQTDASVLLDVAAFIFALDTAKSRYPDLLPGVEVGGLVLDTCTDAVSALRTLGDFHTCAVDFRGPAGVFGSISRASSNATSTPNWKAKRTETPSPSQNLGYVIHGEMRDFDVMERELRDSAKYPTVAFVENPLDQSEIATVNAYHSAAITDVLHELDWDVFVILSEESLEHSHMANALKKRAISKSLCLIAHIQFEPDNFWKIQDQLSRHEGLPVVLISSQVSRKKAFDWLKKEKSLFKWVISVVNEERIDVDTNDFPWGSILIDSSAKWNDHFFNDLVDSVNSPRIDNDRSSWYRDLWRLRFDCYLRPSDRRFSNADTACPSTAPASDLEHVTRSASYVIASVDSILHGAHEQYMQLCPEASGICDAFGALLLKRPRFTTDVIFQYQLHEIEFRSGGTFLPTLLVYNVQRGKIIEVGQYFKSSLDMNVTSVRLYSSSGDEISQMPLVQCPYPCKCQGDNASAGAALGLLPEDTHWATRGEFKEELWAIIVVCIAGVGAVTSIILGIYVVYKICKGALARRYVGLGLLLLLSFLMLYTAVVPFVFTPNEGVCGVRFLFTGLCHALCYSVVLVKLMTLQSYKMIGLGGEVSGLNQMLTVFFMVAVQVAIGVQWWTYNTPTYRTELDIVAGTLKYACNFDREDFAMYFSYDMFLLLICSLYSIAVRNEKKNLGEAKLLLAFCWLSMFIWAAWLLCLFFLDRKYADAIICAGLLAEATSGILIVFIPKVRQVARLRYDLSQKGPFRNGYSVDTDFLYERPYSLPGTLTSTYSAKVNYPKTFSNFDSEMNY